MAVTVAVTVAVGANSQSLCLPEQLVQCAMHSVPQLQLQAKLMGRLAGRLAGRQANFMGRQAARLVSKP